MGFFPNDGEMEGWLYVIRSNRIGLQYSRKRYFILDQNQLNSYKFLPASKSEEPVKSVVIDSCIRVTDDGRATIQRKVFFMFTLYSSANHNNRLKLGATSSEESAQWIRSFNEASLKCSAPQGNIMTSTKKKWHSFRSKYNKGSSSDNSLESPDWTASSSGHTNPTTVDVLAPSPWTIFGCQNGLRLFKEAKDRDFGKDWDDHPAIMAVGVVDGTSEAIFQTIMSLGSSRSEWDFCFSRGSVVETIDGHTDIIHKLLSGEWLPWGMARRDLLLQRYWRREDDGSYVILYQSVQHKKCRHQSGYIRAFLKSGGYVISPVNQGKQSVVKHMLAIDWKFWKSYVVSSSAKSTTIRMLGRIAALREFFKAKLGNYPYSDLLSHDTTKEIDSPQREEHIKVEVQSTAESKRSEVSEEDKLGKSPKIARLSSSFLQLSDAADEFFDVPEPSDSEQSDDSVSSEMAQERPPSPDHYPGTPIAASDSVENLHDLAVPKNGSMDMQHEAEENGRPCSYGTTLLEDPSSSSACSWTTADPSTFLIRGETYLIDNQKVKAKDTLMQMVAADWLRSDKREDNLGGRPGSIVQKYAAQGGKEFFFIVNIQVPGASTYNLALYYMLEAPIESIPLLDNFVKGDNAYRNSRFKLIPYIAKGSWIVKQSVGKNACLIGQALEINYYQGPNYLEVGIDVGSSTVARGVVSLVLGYLTNLVIELAFVIQANTQEELPECLLGTCRLNCLDVSKSVLAKSS